jgi:recombination protein RecT
MSDQTKAITTYDRIKNLAHNQQVINSFAVVIGSKTAAQSYIASALLAVNSNDALMECDPASVWSTVLRAATLQLSCDPALGQAFPVPYNDRKRGKVATLQLGYKGIEQMALRTGQYRYIQTNALYEGQMIEENPLTGAVELHGQRKTDRILGYFNYFELFNGFIHVLYMTVEELEAHAAKYSKNYKYDSSIWKTDFDKMCRKTVLRLNLMRHGMLNSQDKAVIDAIKDDGAELDGEVIDTSFENIDDTVAPPAPVKHTEAENMAALGYEPEPVKAKAPAPEAPKEPEHNVPWAKTMMTPKNTPFSALMPDQLEAIKGASEDNVKVTPDMREAATILLAEIDKAAQPQQ